MISDGYRPFMGPTGGRHVSNSINTDIGSAILFGGIVGNAQLLMHNWTVNRGVIWTIAMDIVFVGLQIGRRLMFMIYASAHSTVTNERSCNGPCRAFGRPGSVPFVSERPGTYGRLLQTVYMLWRTGLLVPSDWFRPVTRGGWRAGFPEPVRGLADVS